MSDLKYRATLSDDPYIRSLRRMEQKTTETNQRMARSWAGSQFDKGLGKVIGSPTFAIAGIALLTKSLREAAKANAEIAAGFEGLGEVVNSVFADIGTAIYHNLLPGVEELGAALVKTKEANAWNAAVQGADKMLRTRKEEIELLKIRNALDRDRLAEDIEHRSRLDDNKDVGTAAGRVWQRHLDEAENERHRVALRNIAEAKAAEEKAAADKDAAQREAFEKSHARELASLAYNEERARIEQLRMDGRETEARLAEARLRTEKELADLYASEVLSEQEKFEWAAKIMAARDAEAAGIRSTGEREKLRSAVEETRRRGYVIGGLAARDATLRQVFGGTDPSGFARQQVQLAQQSKEILAKIERKVGGAYLN